MPGMRQLVGRLILTPASVVAVVLLLAGVPTLAAPAATADDVRIIVNRQQANVPLSRELLWAIFTMRLRQWPGGTPIHVFVLPDDAALSNEFCREELGTYPYVLRSLWDRMVFTGTGLAPTVVRSEQEMRARVNDTPGAIGYIGTGGASWFGRHFHFNLAGHATPPGSPAS